MKDIRCVKSVILSSVKLGSKSYAEVACGESPKFLTVMHDGWDPNRDKMFGASVSWIDPFSWRLNKSWSWFSQVQ